MLISSTATVLLLHTIISIASHITTLTLHWKISTGDNCYEKHLHYGREYNHSILDTVQCTVNE